MVRYNVSPGIKGQIYYVSGYKGSDIICLRVYRVRYNVSPGMKGQI